MTEDEKNKATFEDIFDSPPGSYNHLYEEHSESLVQPEIQFFSPPKYTCARHGEIGNDTLGIAIKDLSRIWCTRCIVEAMEHLYICKAEKI